MGKGKWTVECFDEKSSRYCEGCIFRSCQQTSRVLPRFNAKTLRTDVNKKVSQTKFRNLFTLNHNRRQAKHPASRLYSALYCVHNQKFPEKLIILVLIVQVLLDLDRLVLFESIVVPPRDVDKHAANQSTVPPIIIFCSISNRYPRAFLDLPYCEEWRLARLQYRMAVERV